MSHALLLTMTGIAILGVIVTITVWKLPPVIALLLGTLFLGLTTGVGAAGTTKAVTAGFGEVMADIGLLVTFGVLMGSLLTLTDALRRLIELMLRVFGERSIPYVFAVSLSSLFTSIYSDVLLVLTAPLARRLGPCMGRHGKALMGGALTAGIEVGLVFVVPGVAALAVAGLLEVPLGQMFWYGLIVGLPTAVLTMLVFALLTPRALRWNPALDEIPDEEPREPASGGTAHSAPAPAGAAPGGAAPGGAAPGGAAPAGAASVDAGTGGVLVRQDRRAGLGVSLLPVVATLLLIALGALAPNLGWTSPVLVFVTDPVVAMFAGATTSYLLTCRTHSRAEIHAAMGQGLAACGPILVLSGISGSLGAVIEASGLAKVLGGAFGSNLLPPLVLVWLVAAVLHVALGSISVAAITAAGILAPLAGSLDTPLVFVALAAGSGALFLPHVSSNFFWMFQTMLGLSTRGTFKTHSLAMTLSSVISLPLILLLAAL
ncbi:GntP family permease [Nonomuraea sp. NPDC050790]|uniref:GntP family permease n=1 Tax=Nonomuraea sp. NPDC050790 TaxID=3364371 RepID=UPI0037898B11